MNDSSNILDVQNLSVYFPIEKGIVIKKTVGHIHAVDDISFSIPQGTVLGLVGESGCGKSSTVRALVRLIQAHSGKAYFRGQDILSANKQEMFNIRRNMQMIFQDPYSSLDPRMTVFNIISEPLQVFKHRGLLDLSRQEIIERVEEVMEGVGLSLRFKNRFSYEFSGGQRQRIGIARALVFHPQLLLADEPVSALDVSIQAQILNLLMGLKQKLGLTYLVIAHDLSVVRFISDQIAVMYLGKIVEMVDKETLYKRPLHPYTQALLSAVPIPNPQHERKRKRIILNSDVPSPTEKHRGCCFYHRCLNRMPKCLDNMPELKEVEKNHKVACFLHSDV